jgi:hypothetical protein
MMKTYLVIDAGNLVQNAVLWDGVTAWAPPPGYTAAEANDGEYYEFGKPRGIAPPSQQTRK